MKEKFSKYDVQISYLTPFNRKQAGDAADSLPTVRVFEEFARGFPRSRHLSWLDVASIPWNGNGLWKQHQAFVRQRISSLKELGDKTKLNRGFATFFGKEASDRFSARLSELGITGTNISLSEFRDKPSFAKSFADAFEILLDAPNVSRHLDREDKFPNDLRKRFLDSLDYQIHEAIFDLSKRFNFVWIQGESNYGVRTAHRNHSGGVSLLTCYWPNRLVVGQPR